MKVGVNYLVFSVLYFYLLQTPITKNYNNKLYEVILQLSN